MSLRFRICSELARAYAHLVYDPDAICGFQLAPHQTMWWVDEHPGNSIGPTCHLECYWSIHRLVIARQQIWDHGGVEQEFAELWGDAIATIPEWPGFQRLDLNQDTRALMVEYADEANAFFEEAMSSQHVRLRMVDRLPAPGEDLLTD